MSNHWYDECIMFNDGNTGLDNLMFTPMCPGITGVHYVSGAAISIIAGLYVWCTCVWWLGRETPHLGVWGSIPQVDTCKVAGWK
jgi:hypothetical protein